jgi:glycosyltransferase involved in cell wall biosynthesis
MILSVGRFFARIEESNHKRHDALIDAFALVSLAHPDWELHLAGSKAPGEATERYLEELRESASGLRVYFHCDASKAELSSLYNDASIYWHAAGFGEGSADHPERQEHFGITTVEAMSAGAVPIVFPGGGQREIVSDGVDGYHWESLRSLVEHTSALMEDESALRAMSRRAQCAARRFGPERFRRDFGREVERVVRESLGADDVRRRKL